MVVIWSDWKRYLLARDEMQCQENFKIGWQKEGINLLAAKFPPRRPPYCLLRFSHQHNARVILTVPLSEMYATVGSAIACDRLRLYGNNSLCDRIRSAICDPRSSAIVCDHMETSLKELSRPIHFPRFLYVSWRKITSLFCLWSHLKMERLFIDLLSPLTLRERHFRLSVKIPKKR